MMLGPGVEISLPPSWFFKFPPDPLPWTLPPPPPSEDFTEKAPINVDIDFFNSSLRPEVPITFALGYLTFALVFNRVNRSRGNKPWPISKTWAFRAFVLLHNTLLALYSGITCAALIRAIRVSWPGLNQPGGLATAADALCKMHGPRGYGDAATYDAAKLVWGVKNKAIHLGLGGIAPDPTDVGRIWNEGLAFWGWLFYLSKFYEVVDTLIILLKGKRSSTLQTYHHAGAMLCMWAGIRYMSPPIWMFVLVNSGIHTMMYTYYTIAALRVPVRNGVKGIITTLQIVQFVVGASYASAHLFVSYSIPVATRYYVASAIKSAAAPIASAAEFDSPSWLKRLAYRAAGFEGLAERVVPEHSGIPRAPQFALPTTSPPVARYRSRYEMTRCLDTSGEAFAIWLNVIYLAPLTLLFLRFFWKTYISSTRAHKGGKTYAGAVKEEKDRRISDAARDAGRDVVDEVEEAGKKVEDVIGGVMGEEVLRGGRDVVEEEAVDETSGEEMYRPPSNDAPRTSSDGRGDGGSGGSMTVESVQEKLKESARDLKDSLTFSMTESMEWVEETVLEGASKIVDTQDRSGGGSVGAETLQADSAVVKSEDHAEAEAEVEAEVRAEQAREESTQTTTTSTSSSASTAAAAAASAYDRGLQKTAFTTTTSSSSSPSRGSQRTSRVTDGSELPIVSRTTSTSSRGGSSIPKRVGGNGAGNGAGARVEEGMWLSRSSSGAKQTQKTARTEESSSSSRAISTASSSERSSTSQDLPRTPAKAGREEEEEEVDEVDVAQSPDWGFGLKG